MKIIFLTRRFYPDIGGVEKHVYEISKILIKKNHKVTVVTETEGENNELGGIKIIRIPPSRKGRLRKFFIWYWFLKNRDIFNKAKIIHAHDVYYQYLPLKFLFPSKKSFITFHGYESYPIPKKAILIRKLSELIANGNIVVGDFIRKWYFTKANYVIYGGVNQRKHKKIIVKIQSAVFIGRLDEQTNILEYVKAIDLLKKEYPKFNFKIVGDGNFFEKLKDYNPTGFKENVDDYLSKNNFAFVSRYLSILEALINKRLVFALYDNPVKEDYLKMSPFYKFIICADSSEALVRKIKYFLCNPNEIDKFTRKGYLWAKKQTWENVSEVYLNLWRKS